MKSSATFIRIKTSSPPRAKDNMKIETTSNTITTISYRPSKEPEYEFSNEEKKKYGIIDIPPLLEFAFQTINETGQENLYLLNDKGIENVRKVEKSHLLSRLYRKMLCRSDRKEELRLKRETNRKKIEEAMAKARKIKDYQRRDQTGLLTPEELAERETRRQAKKDKWLKKE